MRFKIGYAIFMFWILTELTGLPTMLSLKKIALLTLLFIFVGIGITAETALPEMKFKDVK